jgi:hypothetical protein
MKLPAARRVEARETPARCPKKIPAIRPVETSAISRAAISGVIDGSSLVSKGGVGTDAV